MRKILLVMFLLLLTMNASAAEWRHKHNPDERTSILVTAGIGNLDGMRQDGEADLTTFGLGLTYPATNNISFLVGWDKTETQWSGDVNSWWPRLKNWNTEVFTVGAKFYLP